MYPLKEEMICTALEIHPIVKVVEPVPPTDDANIQEEDTIAYIQFMDEINPTNGDSIENNNSYLSQLKKKGIIQRRTAFFDPDGYSNTTSE